MKKLLLLSAIAAAAPLIYRNGTDLLDRVAGPQAPPAHEHVEPASEPPVTPQANDNLTAEKASTTPRVAAVEHAKAVLKKPAIRSRPRRTSVIKEKSQASVAKPVSARPKKTPKVEEPVAESASPAPIITRPATHDEAIKDVKSELSQTDLKPVITPEEDRKWADHLTGIDVALQHREEESRGCREIDCRFEQEHSMPVFGIVMTTTRQAPYVNPLEGSFAQGNYYDQTPLVYIQ